MEFTKKQAERYSRQLILKKIGIIGQKKLIKSSVLIVGAGGLGSPVAIYLAAMGIGKIGIIDNDRVEISNQMFDGKLPKSVGYGVNASQT